MPREAGPQRVWLRVKEAPVGALHMLLAVRLEKQRSTGSRRARRVTRNTFAADHGKTLRRQTILKCDHFELTPASDLEGARGRALSARSDNVFGVAKARSARPSALCRWLHRSRVQARAVVLGCAPPSSTSRGAILQQEPQDSVRQRREHRRADRRGARRRRSSENPISSSRRSPTDGVPRVQLLSSEGASKPRLEEAQRYNKILLHGERVPEADSSVAAWGEVYSYWEEVTQDSGRPGRASSTNSTRACRSNARAHHRRPARRARL